MKQFQKHADARLRNARAETALDIAARLGKANVCRLLICNCPELALQVPFLYLLLFMCCYKEISNSVCLCLQPFFFFRDRKTILSNEIVVRWPFSRAVDRINDGVVLLFNFIF